MSVGQNGGRIECSYQLERTNVHELYGMVTLAKIHTARQCMRRSFKSHDVDSEGSGFLPDFDVWPGP